MFWDCNLDLAEFDLLLLGFDGLNITSFKDFDGNMLRLLAFDLNTLFFWLRRRYLRTWIGRLVPDRCGR